MLQRVHGCLNRPTPSLSSTSQLAVCDDTMESMPRISFAFHLLLDAL